MIATKLTATEAKEVETQLLNDYISKKNIVLSLSKEYFDNNYSDFMAKVEERTVALNALRTFQMNNQGLLDL